MRTVLIALTLTLFSSTPWVAPPLEAQRIPSPYRFIDTRQELGTFVGYMDADRGRFSLGPGPGTVYGVRYSIKLGETPLAFEATSFALPTSRHLVDPRRPEGERVMEDLDSFLLGADARLRFSLTGPRTWHHLNPFASLGLGAAADLRSHDVEDLPIGAEFDFRFGPAFMAVAAGGVRWLPLSHLGFRGEANLNLWRLGTPRGFTDLEDELGTVPENEWVASPAFTFAVTYLF